jgi:YD repeat-containing protein
MIAVAELALMGAEQRGDVTAHGTTLTDSATGAIDRTYDVLDRVTQEVTPQGIVNFTYDALSRRLTMRANAQQGEEKGTGYFSEDFRGRPRWRRVDSRPKAVAITACQSAVPKGCWRFTQVRSAVSS